MTFGPLDAMHEELPTKTFYRPQLDVVRFAAFLAVFLHHAIPRTGSHSGVETVADGLGFGLSLFFVLSAYLITLLLLRERDQTGKIHLAAFYTRRILRIWPLYLLGLAIGVFRALAHGVLQQQKAWFIAALLLAGNFVNPNNILMSHLWSISIEEQFYLFVPTFCRNFGRRGMFAIAVLLIVGANITLTRFAHLHVDVDVVWMSSFVQFEMFSAGILLALFDESRPRLGPLMSAVMALGSIGTWLACDAVFHLKTLGVLAHSPVQLCVGYALVAVSCCTFILAVQGLPSPGALIYSGRISYGLYVFHIPVIAVITARVHGIAGALVSLAVTFGIAAVSYQYYEKPFLRLKRRFEFVPTHAPHRRAA